MSGSYPAQNFRRKVNRWICTPLFDVGDKVPPKAINDVSQGTKRQ